MRTTVLFFLAHDGVKQPVVWNRWLSECRKEGLLVGRKIIARVFCNPDKVAENRIGSVLPFHIPTRWAGPSLVKVLQEGYKAILNETRDVDMIFLVSGYDIPIMKPKDFIKLPIRSYFPISEDLVEMPQKIYNRLAISSIRKIQPTKSSIQWTHLEARHASIIARSDLSVFIKWLDTLNEQEKTSYVYDEVLPIAILETAGVLDQLKDEPLTGMERKEDLDVSPIVFKTLRGRYIMFRESHDDLEEGEIIEEQQRFSLNYVIRDHINDEFVFFRKVAETVVFDKMPWLI